MSTIYWDTMLFVYWLEDHPTFADRIGSILQRMEERGDRLCTSSFTLGELLVGPYKCKDTSMIARIQETFSEPFVRVLPFTADAAGHYARIRAQLRVSPAEAIHLACAAQSGVDLFLTNDSSLAGKIVPGIQFIAGINTEIL
jgi:predicted nucleic acid-binding protein